MKTWKSAIIAAIVLSVAGLMWVNHDRILIAIASRKDIGINNQSLLIDRDKLANFEERARNGNGEAALAVYWHYLALNKIDKAFPFLYIAVRQGNSAALAEYEVCVREGSIVVLDEEKQMQLTKRAEQGDGDAAFLLYGFYRTGEANFEKSIPYLVMAARAGNLKARGAYEYLASEHKVKPIDFSKPVQL